MNSKTALSSSAEVVAVYRKRARHFNFTANLYYLIGFREWAYRRQVVKALGLHPGDTVVDIGCGTGLNFSLLQEAIGPRGKIIGVDLTDAMLVQAAARAARENWRNVELIESDALLYKFPPRINGILSTFAISMLPEAATVIQNGAEALAPGGRWAILDFKLPSFTSAGSPWTTTLVLPLVSPFGVTREMIARRPWLINQEALKRFLVNTTWQELHVGIAYIATGERPRSH